VYEANGKLKCTHASPDLDCVVLVEGAGAADAPVPPLPIGMLPLPGAKPQRLTAVAADDGCVVLVGGGAAAELLLPLLHATHDAPPIVPLGDPTAEVEAETEAETDSAGAGEAAAGSERQPIEQPTDAASRMLAEVQATGARRYFRERRRRVEVPHTHPPTPTALRSHPAPNPHPKPKPKPKPNPNQAVAYATAPHLPPPLEAAMRDSLAYHVELTEAEAEDGEPSSLALVYQLPQVLRAMREHLVFPEVQQQAAVALANIAHQRQRQYARQTVEAGACETLVAALVAHPANTKVLLACCAALAQLAAGGAACVDAVGRSGALEAVLGVMHRCTDEAELLGWGCTLLAALATDAAARERAVDQGAPRRVSHAMRAHVAQTSLQQHGCNALANLSAMAPPSRAHAKALADAHTAAALAGAMREHMKNVPLLEQACAALFNLARCGTLSKELEARPRDFGEAVQGLVAVLKAHPRRKVLQHCGRQVVLQLAELARGDGTSNTALQAIAMDAALQAAGVPPAWREARDEGASPDAPD